MLIHKIHTQIELYTVEEDQYVNNNNKKMLDNSIVFVFINEAFSHIISINADRFEIDRELRDENDL